LTVAHAHRSNLRLKERLQRRDALIVPGAPNALTARLIEDIGFEAAYVTGAGVTNMFLGAPDIGLITLSELADHVAAMRDAVAIPLIVDADTGFGNAINVGRTVRMLERSGANAIQLEDQDFPKRCGHFSGKSVIPSHEMVQKVRAAVDARHDADTLIVARTDAIALHGLEDALDRARAYVEAGADVTFVEAPRTVADMARIPQEVGVPQIANLVVGGLTPMLGTGELARMGFAMALYANTALQAALLAMQEVLSHLRSTGSLDDMQNRLASFSERQRVVAKPLFDALEKKYA
jgi:2-methylisocitrate lyase-like PEP mutase family enzyme